VPEKTELRDAAILLGGSIGTLRIWCEHQAHVSDSVVSSFLNTLSYVTASRLVEAADPLVHRYAAVIGKAAPNQAVPAEEVLHFEVGLVYAAGWIGVTGSPSLDLAVGLAAQLRSWANDLKASGYFATDLTIRELDPPSHARLGTINPEGISHLVLAAVDRHASEQRDAGYLLKVERIGSGFGLRPGELHRLLGVSAEGLRGWQHGGRISEDRWPDIDRLYSALQHLMRYIKPSALPAVIRRRNPSLNNQSALDWLMNRRDAELLRFYDDLFSYGRTK